VIMIPTLRSREYVAPKATPLTAAVAGIYPRAQRSARHVGGEVKGSMLTYSDLHAFTWWYGGGWITLNRGRKGLRRVHRGAEDVSRVRR